ncbi:MAG: [NiFe]-hydrogenase assembly chaperone HybE [Casimicrobiaceae bacterium]
MSDTSTGTSDAALRDGPTAGPRPDPAARLVHAFRAAATRMTGLSFVNPALAVEAVGFAPWQGCWLGVLVTPWFMNLILVARDVAVWQSLPQGEKRCYRFPAGAYEFMGAHDELAGEYQLCSLFSPVLQFEDQATARLVAQLARDALFDLENAEKPETPLPNLSPGPAPDPTFAGPFAGLEAQLDAPQSKRDFLRGRWAGDDRGNRG